MADWVIIQTQATPAKVPLSIVAVSQANSSKVTRISPMPLEKGQVSFSPSSPSVDSANNLIYSFDGTAGKLVAIKLDTTTGNMSIAWGPVTQRTFSFLTLVVPANQRVLVATNISTSLNQPAGCTKNHKLKFDIDTTGTDQTSPTSTKHGIQNTVAETNPIPYFLPTMQKA